MTPEQRRYLFVQSAIGAAVVNALLNGGIGVLITVGLTEFPVWKTPGVAGDLVATAFGVTFGTCLGAVLQVRLDLAKGKISPPTTLPPALAAFASRVPRGLWKRAFVLGALSVPVFAPLAIGLVAASGAEALARGSFVALKAGFSAFEGAIVTPFIVLAALLDTVDARPPS